MTDVARLDVDRAAPPGLDGRPGSGLGAGGPSSPPGSAVAHAAGPRNSGDRTTRAGADTSDASPDSVSSPEVDLTGSDSSEESGSSAGSSPAGSPYRARRFTPPRLAAAPAPTPELQGRPTSPLRPALALRLRAGSDPTLLAGAPSPLVPSGSTDSLPGDALLLSPSGRDLRRPRTVKFDDRASATSVRTFYASDPALLINAKYQLRTLTPLLARPRRPVETAALAHGRGVVLEAATFVYPKLGGTIVVRNIAFHKHVFVRVSTDDWKHTRDVDAEWVELAAEAGLERFRFEVDLTADYRDQGTLHMCVGYESGGQSLWDNRFGANYHATMVCETLYREFVHDHPTTSNRFVAPGEWLKSSNGAAADSDDDDGGGSSSDETTSDNGKDDDDEDDDEDDRGRGPAGASEGRPRRTGAAAALSPALRTMPAATAPTPRSLLAMDSDIDLVLRPPPVTKPMVNFGTAAAPAPPGTAAAAAARPVPAVATGFGWFGGFGVRAPVAGPTPPTAAAAATTAAAAPKRLSLDSDSRDDFGELFGGRRPPLAVPVQRAYAVPALASPAGVESPWHDGPRPSWGSAGSSDDALVGRAAAHVQSPAPGPAGATAASDYSASGPSQPRVWA